MHLFDFALVDFFYVDKMLRQGGFVAFHDMWMPSLRKLVSFIVRNRRYERVLTDTVSGLKWRRRILKTGKRLLQFGLDRNHSGLRFSFGSENLCVLRKLGDDDRVYDDHQLF